MNSLPPKTTGASTVAAGKEYFTNGHARGLIFILSFLVFFVLSCSGSDTSPDEGSIAFSIQFPDAASSLTAYSIYKQDPISCDDYGITIVVANVFDENDTLIAEGGPWECSTGRGMVSGIRQGTNRSVIIDLIDDQGRVILTGTRTNITVIAAQTTSVGVIELDLVLPEVVPAWYRDADGDSYGDPDDSILSVIQPAGYVSDNTDCNDGDAGINPGAEEICEDGIDQDCDGNDPSCLLLWYRDADTDTYGNPDDSTLAAAQPAGYVSDNTDCNDGDAGIYPGAEEICEDGIDQDCDGTDPSCIFTWFRDADGDSYGNPDDSVQATSQPAGYVSDNTDCNDADPTEHPDQTWYKDTDDDGYSDGITDTASCTRPAGYKVSSELTDTSIDCNDGAAGINPGAVEICGDAIDQDCDGTDPPCLLTWYRDADSDTFGNPLLSVQATSQPDGYVIDNTDCNDGEAGINPGAVEICGDGIDQDCDGIDPPCPTNWYQDADTDTYGNPAVLISAVEQPAGYVSDNTDCNDANAEINPGAVEICGDSIDQDCDGTDPPCPTNWYQDADTDTYGNPAVSISAVEQPAGYVSDNTDCNDVDPNEHPDQTWYKDSDNDGYSDGITDTASCTRPAGYKVSSELTATSGDCNDGEAGINPDAEEICGDSIDQDCDGSDLPCIVTLSMNPEGAARVFVDQDGGRAENLGTSWEQAVTTIQDAINIADEGAEVWVKQGNYLLTHQIEVNKSIGVYGGFTGTEQFLDERDWQGNITTVNGQNFVRCFSISVPAETVIIDGFSIINGLSPSDAGGGIHNHEGASSISVANCIFRNNHALQGGGIYNDNPDSGLHIIRCIFENNSASETGGGTFSQAAYTEIVHCIYNQNEGGSGGGISCISQAARITNCIFIANSCYTTYPDNTGGGADIRSSSDASITNCTFTGNSASSGGGIFSLNSTVTVINSIIWNNVSDNGTDIYGDTSIVSIDYCDLSGVTGSETCIYEDPRFADPANSDFHLLYDSPCIDSGTSDVPMLPEVDFEGEPRIIGVNVDIGADEYMY